MAACVIDKAKVKSLLNVVLERLANNERFKSNGSSLLKDSEVLELVNATDNPLIAKQYLTEYLNKSVISSQIILRTTDKVKAYFSSGDAFNTQKEPTELTIVGATIVNKGTDRFVNIEFRNENSEKQNTYSYTFDPGSYSDSSYATDKGNRIKILGIGQAIASANISIGNLESKYFKEALKKEGVTLTEYLTRWLKENSEHMQPDVGSMDNLTDKNLDEYTKVENYTHGNIAHMQRLLGELYSTGRFPKTEKREKHLEEMKKLFGALHESFFHKVDVYIKNDAPTTQGWVSYKGEALGIEISNTTNPNEIFMTEVEVYAHEVIHTMTDWAMLSNDPNAKKLIRKMHYLRSEVIKQTTWKNFLAVDPATANSEDIKRAKAIFKYITVNHGNTPSSSLKEFITYGLTNPAVMAHLEKVILKDEVPTTAWEKLKAFFTSLMSIVLGNEDFYSSDKTAKDRLVNLAIRIGEINNASKEGSDNRNVGQHLMDWLDDAEATITNKINQIENKVFPDTAQINRLSSNAGLLETAAYTAKFFYKSFTNKHYAAALGTVLSTWGLKADSTIREIVANLIEETDNRKNANWLGLLANKINALRNAIVELTARNVTNGFNRPLSDAQQVDFTEVLLDTNAGHLLYENNLMPLEKLQDILLNTDNVLFKEMASVKKELGEVVTDKERYNLMIGQAKGLGYYMATGNGSSAISLNSESIVQGVNTGKAYPANEKLTQLVRKLTSLEALYYTSKEQKDSVADIIKTDPNGVTNTLDVMETFKVSSRSLFIGDSLHMMEGYLAEKIDDSIKIEYAPLDEKAEMESKGFKLAHTFKSKVDDSLIGMYVTPKFTRPERQQGALALVNNTAKGASIKDSVFRSVQKELLSYDEDTPAEHIKEMVKKLSSEQIKKALDKIGNKSNKIKDKMLNGTYDPKLDADNILPTINESGKIVDYRQVMDKANKKTILKLDNRVTVALGYSMGTVLDKKMRAEHEDKILDEMKEVMNTQWVSGDIGSDTVTEFIQIGPNVENEKYRQMYYMLPQKFRAYIDSRKDKVLAIPAELELIYFGYQHSSLSSNILTPYLHTFVVQILGIVDRIWLDLVKLTKQTILLKMPQVLVANIISNAIYMISSGVGPTEVFKMHIESWRNVEQFLKDSKTRSKLKLEISVIRNKINRTEDVTALVEELDKLKVELNLIIERMDENPVKELFDLGMSQSLIEGEGIDGLGESNIITDTFDNLTEKFPVIIKTPLQWLYLSKQTSWFKVNNHILQISDLVSRDVLNRKEKMLEEKQANGQKVLPQVYLDFTKDKYGIELPSKLVIQDEHRDEFFKVMEEHRRYKVLKSFINYTQPNGKFEEMLNRYGIVMFTKYLKRIQPVIMTLAKEKPIRSLLTVAIASGLFNLPDVQEQSMLVKGTDNNGNLDIGGLIRISDPYHNLITVINPPLVNLIN